MNNQNNQVNVFDVANYIIKNNPHITTHMKLHKMIYYAYSKYLVDHYPKTLFNEKISAWFHGPVVNKLYPVFKNFLAKPIDILTPKRRYKKNNTRCRNCFAMDYSKIRPHDWWRIKRKNTPRKTLFNSLPNY